MLGLQVGDSKPETANRRLQIGDRKPEISSLKLLGLQILAKTRSSQSAFKVDWKKVD